METPRYELQAPLYADDFLWDAGLTIEFDGPPNEQMTPLNEPARERMKAYLQTLEGGRTPDVADVMLKAMTERPKHDVVPVNGAMQIVGTSTVDVSREPKIKVLDTHRDTKPIKIGAPR